MVDATDELVGVVSEADLLMKEEHVADGEPHHRFQSRRRRIARAKAGGVVAQELMSSPAETIDPGRRSREAARLMHERRVKRLPGRRHERQGCRYRQPSGSLEGVPPRGRRDPPRDRGHAREAAFQPGPIRVTVVDGIATLEDRSS